MYPQRVLPEHVRFVRHHGALTRSVQTSSARPRTSRGADFFSRNSQNFEQPRQQPNVTEHHCR